MKGKILIVDDDESTAKMSAWSMEAQGHEARVALSGNDAITMVNEFVPDAVLLDLGMPDMDGYEVCEALRGNALLANCLFIAVTGWASDRHRRLSKIAGFHHHLEKPVDFHVIEKILDEHFVSH